MDPVLSSFTPSGDDAPPFLVGIAGASSSGKTVLSLILSEIFEAAIDQGQHNISAARSSTTTASTITMISQDDYFIAKSECPRTAFRPRPGDKTVVAGHVGSDGRVEAADTDCLAAVDWVHLLGDIDAFLAGQRQQGGTPRAAPNAASAHQAELARYRTMIDSFVEPKLRERMICSVRACIDQQVMLNSFDKFEGRWFKKGPRGKAKLNCRLGFVEGFLLYAREPPLPLKEVPQPGLDDGHDDASSKQQQPEPRMQRADKISQEAIKDRCHDRLYLHVSTETACQRRFDRETYIDQPQGQRAPGQLWKTKGYFFDVVRANFYKYDLIDPSHATQLWQGQDIIENAIESILDKMKKYEAEAREMATRSAKEEESMARVKGETNTFW